MPWPVTLLENRFWSFHSRSDVVFKVQKTKTDRKQASQEL